jgi:hypothetical protein
MDLMESSDARNQPMFMLPVSVHLHVLSAQLLTHSHAAY